MMSFPGRKKISVISIEGGQARLVRGASAKGTANVTEASVMAADKLDEFLANDTAREYVVVNHFGKTYHDVLTLPPAKGKFLRKLVELELEKRCPFRDFVFAYRVTGEKRDDNENSREVFAFAVEKAAVEALSAIFERNGKQVAALYPDILAVAGTVDSEKGDSLIAYGAGPNRSFAVTRDGKPVFIRDASSVREAEGSFLADDIEMTINYCRQSLRLSPASVALSGALCDAVGEGVRFSTPARCLLPAGFNKGVRVSSEFYAPVAALSSGEWMDMLPESSKQVQAVTEAFRVMAAVAAAASVLMFLYGAALGMDALKIKQRIDAVSGAVPETMELLRQYDLRLAEVNQHQGVVATISGAATQPDLAFVMMSMRGLRPSGVEVDSFNMEIADGRLVWRLAGRLTKDKFAEAYADYESVLASIRGMGRLDIAGSSVSLKDRTFKIEGTLHEPAA